MIKFESYWNTTFTHFGLTKPTDPIHLKYKKEEATIETEIIDDFVLDKKPAQRIITSNEELEKILRGRQDADEEEVKAERPGSLTRMNDSMSQISQSKSAFESIKNASKVKKLSLKDMKSRISEIKEGSSIGQ